VIPLFRKEISSFFSSIAGYVVVSVFLLSTGLFLWVLPGPLNIIQSGYATLDNFFITAPWLFLLLVPAVTMRLFAEEKTSATLEWLLTKPLSEMEIILAKYFAGITLVLLSLIPCLLYFFTVYLLGNPPGNIDTGATWGSFTGLFLLAATYTAIGIFSSAAAGNQVVALILAVILCLFFYLGFDYVASFLTASKGASEWGINYHYESLSRGVIDSRDLVYFFSCIALFIYSTQFFLQKRKW